MGILENFMAYAQDFEKTYEDDDWQRLHRYFADDAVYEVDSATFATRLEGPEAILGGIRKSVDGFDRRMATRVIELTAPPRVSDESVEVDWAVTYTLGEAPPLRAVATSKATYAGDKIVHLVDSYPKTEGDAFTSWLERHAPDLDPSYT